MRHRFATRLITTCLFAAGAALAGTAGTALAAAKPAPAEVAKPSAAKPAVAKSVANSAGKSAAKAVPADDAGYTIAPAPAWVTPVAADPQLAMPMAPLQLLLVDGQTRVDPKPAATTRYRHTVRRINDAAGLQQGAQIEIDFDPSYQKLQLHRLEIWREGKRIDKLDRKLVKLLQRETQLERQLIDGRKTASIVLDDLRVGDRVEWAFSLVGDNPVFAGKHVDAEWTSSSKGPVGQAHIRLLAPAERKIIHRASAKLGIEVSEQLRPDGWRETVFRRRAVPQFHYDPLTPAVDYLADQIEFSEFASWAEVGAWARQLFAQAATGLDALTPQAEAIKARTATPEERLRLALDFVQQEIRYFGTEMGANSHLPAPADQVLRQRFGDCKDKSALLVNLLAKLGIEATPVLVSTYLRADAAGRLPSPLVFDHVIAGVQLDGKTLWLDATRNLQTGSPASRQSMGLSRGLLASADSSELAVLPSAREALRSETRDTFRFPRLAEPGRFESVTVFHGDMAEFLRSARAAMPEEELTKSLLTELLRAYPSLTLDGAPRFEDVQGRNALKLSLAFTIGEGYWRFPEQRQLAGDFALLSLITPLRLPSPTPRTQPMLLQMPGRYLHTLRFEFGEDAFPQASSSRYDESNEHFKLGMRYQGELRSQQIDGELSFNTEQIAPEKWSAYRDQLTKVFPRLGAALNVSPLSPADLAGLRKALGDLDTSLRRGSVKAATAEQVTARTRLLVADRMLAADRLPPKLRAQVLVERGTQLDHIGNVEAARHAFQDAARLDAQDPEVHEALATNALMRAQDQEAIAHAARALAIAPNKVQPRYTRAWANYFAGQLPQAREELQDILQSTTEVERSYGSIWLYLTARRLGEDGGSAARALQLPSDSKPGWPFPVLQLMRGSLDLDAALAVAREDAKTRLGRECELYFYAAQKALADQDTAKARAYLRKSLDTGVVEFNEYAFAKRELERIGAR